MDTLKMVTEIKSACTTLERKRTELMAKVKEIDDKLSYYNMAIDSLQQTIGEVCGTVDDIPVSGGRKAAMYEYKGVTHSLPEWSKQLGIDVKTLRHRLKIGWPIEDVLGKPVGNSGPKPKRNMRAMPKKVYAYDKFGNVIRQYIGIGEASRDLNLPVTTIEKLIENVDKEDQIRCRNYYLAYVG